MYFQSLLYRVVLPTCIIHSECDMWLFVKSLTFTTPAVEVICREKRWRQAWIKLNILKRKNFHLMCLILYLWQKQSALVAWSADWLSQEVQGWCGMGTFEPWAVWENGWHVVCGQAFTFPFCHHFVPRAQVTGWEKENNGRYYRNRKKVKLVEELDLMGQSWEMLGPDEVKM